MMGTDEQGEGEQDRVEWVGVGVWHKRDLTRASVTPLDRRNLSSDKTFEADTYWYMTRDQRDQTGSTPSPDSSLLVWVLW